MSLENAPDEVKLAVDLIMLLENHEIPAETVLKALEIVRRDFEGKLPPHPALSPEGRGLGGGAKASDRTIYLSDDACHKFSSPSATCWSIRVSSSSVKHRLFSA